MMDLEMETGLMSQIQTLIAPPPSESPAKVKRKEPERRRGKGQNRDTCDACGDCGNLICCDKCPAAVHLQCQDPPLDEDDIPLGEWLCRVCRAKANKPKDKKCLEELSPMQMLMKAAQEQNPSMFDVPNNLKIPLPFPGTDKGPKKVTLRRGSTAKKNAPEPSKVCFSCSRGARISPLLSCDYCSSSFHLDCLNPPLTAPPSGTTWMCPNHPEHFLDGCLLKSTSGVERIKLWERATKEMDEHALKLEFIRKASRKNPPFKYKVNLPERQKMQIPSSVVQMYKNPIGLVPSLPNHLKYDKTWKAVEFPSQSDMEDWLSSLIAMQVSLAWDLNSKGLKENDASNDGPVDCEKSTEVIEEVVEHLLSSPSKKNQKLNRTAVDKLCSQLETLSGSIEAQLSKIDPRLIKLLAAQRLQQLLPNFKSSNSVNNCHDSKVKIKETPANEVYASFDENLFLKNGVVCTKKKYVALKDVNGDLKVEEWVGAKRVPTRKMSNDSQGAEEDGTTAARAALAPIGSVYRVVPVPMRFRTLTIGTNPDSDVCLSDFGSCHFTSPKHAVIFFDAMTGEYELLNYSSYGTVVDGCLYCIDSTQCRVPSAAAVSDPLTQGVRAMLDKRRGLKRDSASSGQLPRPVSKRKPICGCQERDSDPTGWEGSAILYHCSHLQFGCLQFVFSVVDFAPSKNLIPESVDRKKKKLEENGEESSAIKEEVVEENKE